MWTSLPYTGSHGFLSHVRSFVTRNVRCCYMSDIPPDDSRGSAPSPSYGHSSPGGYVSVRPCLPYIPSYRMGLDFYVPRSLRHKYGKLPDYSRSASPPVSYNRVSGCGYLHFLPHLKWWFLSALPPLYYL